MNRPCDVLLFLATVKEEKKILLCGTAEEIWADWKTTRKYCPDDNAPVNRMRIYCIKDRYGTEIRMESAPSFGEVMKKITPTITKFPDGWGPDEEGNECFDALDEHDVGVSKEEDGPYEMMVFIGEDAALRTLRKANIDGTAEPAIGVCPHCGKPLFRAWQDSGDAMCINCEKNFLFEEQEGARCPAMDTAVIAHNITNLAVDSCKYFDIAVFTRTVIDFSCGASPALPLEAIVRSLLYDRLGILTKFSLTEEKAREAMIDFPCGQYVYFKTNADTAETALWDFEKVCAKNGIDIANAKPVKVVLRDCDGGDLSTYTP